MGREGRPTEHDVIPESLKFVAPMADYEMSVRDYVVRPSATGITGAFNLVLPPVTEAGGRFYSIVCRKADAVNTVTITDRDDSECWAGDIILNGRCDRVLMYSDGMTWFTCASVLTFVGTTCLPTTSSPTTQAP